jgi:hypothetical protein
MNEEKQAQEPELKRPEDAVEDLEPDAEDTEAVKGGAVDAFSKYDSIKGP